MEAGETMEREGLERERWKGKGGQGKGKGTCYKGTKIP